MMLVRASELAAFSITNFDWLNRTIGCNVYSVVRSVRSISIKNEVYFSTFGK